MYFEKINFIYSGLLILFSGLIIFVTQLQIMCLAELKLNSMKSEKYLKEIFYLSEHEKLFCWVEKDLFNSYQRLLDIKNYITDREENDDVNFEYYLHEPDLNNINPNIDKKKFSHLYNYLLNSNQTKSIKQTRYELRNLLITSNSFSNKRKNLYTLKYFNYE